MELTDIEYDDYQVLAGNATKIDGLGLHERLNQLVRDSHYRNDGDALNAIQIDKEIEAYRKGALAELLETHPGITEAYENRVEGKVRALEAPAQSAPMQRGRLALCHARACQRPR